MGKGRVTTTLESLADHFEARRGRLPDSRVRRIEVPDALVDTEAFGLLVPMRLVERLGLMPGRTRMARTGRGDLPITTYSAVRLTIRGRDCVSDVDGLADDSPVIIGKLALSSMDWVFDHKTRTLIGNPDHGGEEMYDLY